MQELISYIHTNKATQGRIQDEVRDQGAAFPKRNVFVTLRKYADGFFKKGIPPRLVALSGLRGVGKTTLMWQTAEHIFKNYTQEVYFINAEDLKRLNYTLFDFISIFEKEILKKPFYELEEPIVFLFDEVHDLEHWDKDLKLLYEKCKKAFVLCTGSSALLLHRNADLATRWTLERVFPYEFPEFIVAKTWLESGQNMLFPSKGLASKLKSILFFSQDFAQLQSGVVQATPEIESYLEEIGKRLPGFQGLIDEYISYHNIARFLPLEDKGVINNRVIALFERILQQDLKDFDPDSNPELLSRLIMRLALSDEINFQSLAKELRCKEQEVEHFIETLHKAEILNVFLPHGGVRLKTGNRVKPFFMSPSLRRALYARVYGSELKEDLRAKLYEDVVAMYLRRLFEPGLLSFGDAKGKSPDFVVETMDSPVLVEVGINKKSRKQISKYVSDKRYGIVINSKIQAAYFEEDCLFLPLSWFLIL